MDICDFSYRHYKEILGEISNKNYKVVDFNNCDSYKKEIIVRHDIDLDLKKAFKMAEIEKNAGVKANYFFWITSPFYNIFDSDNSLIVKNIIKLGHNVGIHFDEGAYNCSSEGELEQFIMKEINMFEMYFQYRPNVVSFHMPRKELLNNNFKFSNFVNTYHNKFFKQYKYLSDSEMRWREGCVCKKLKLNMYSKIQVLVHPIWWSDNGDNSDEVINEFIKYKNMRLIYNWDKYIKVKFNKE